MKEELFIQKIEKEYGSLEKYIFRAIELKTLNLRVGKRTWRKFTVNIRELVWARNMRDGYMIDLFFVNKKNNEIFLETVETNNYKN